MVEPLTRQGWTELLRASPQATRYLDPDFLDLFKVPVRFWGLNRKGIVIAGLPVIEARAFLGGRMLPWCYYQGILLHGDIWRAAPSKRTQYEIEVFEELATGVAAKESEFHLSLHPMLTDVRGLDWVHYHDPTMPRIRLVPRYTAIVDLMGRATGDLRRACRSARRQEEGYAIDREGLVADADGTIAELQALYAETFARQNIAIPKREAEILPDYCAYFLEHGGQILAVRSQDGAARAAALVFDDFDGTVHVPVVGTGDTRFGGTLLYFHILDTALARGASRVDFDGANSPRRAYFKHSMGASPVLYFEAIWERAS